MKKFLIFFICFFISIGFIYSVENIFIELEKIKLNIDEILFSRLWQIEQLPDGFVILLSRYGNSNMIVKLGKNGDVVSIYDKAGNGPGELRNIYNIAVNENSIYACEQSSPYVHEFTHNLKFKKDYRVKKGGKLFILGDKYAGIWGPNYIGEKKVESIKTLSLYSLRDFSHIKFAFPVAEVPALYHYWGDICRINKTTFAGIYPTEYQIKIFDENMELRKQLIKNVPKHIKKYHPYKGNSRLVDQNIADWGSSWSVLKDIFYSEDRFIIKYLYKKNNFFDIIDRSGKIIYSGYKEDKDLHLIFVEKQKYFWHLLTKMTGDEIKYFLVKHKLKI